MAAAAAVQWKKSAGGNGHLYNAVYVKEGINFVGSVLGARRLGCGWYLATITSKGENDFVVKLLNGRPELFIEGVDGPWLGGFQRKSKNEPAGEWRWETKEPFAYTNWASLEPSNDTKPSPIHPGVPNGHYEDFLGIYANGTWNDLPDNALLKGYVVEFDAAAKKACWP